jgi:putative oxidoreductase
MSTHTDIDTSTPAPTAADEPRTTALPVATPASPEARAAAALAARQEASRRAAEQRESAAGHSAGQPDDGAAPGAVKAPDARSGEGQEASGLADGPRRRADRPADPAAPLVPMPRPVRDVVLLLGRLVLGVVLIVHGAQKLAQGPAATAEGFTQMGIPLPEIAAVFATAAELGGGALLVLGLLTPLAALLPAVVMAGAVSAHAGNGVFVGEGGWEFAATLGVAALVVAVAGPGRLSLDAVLARARQR